MPAALRGLKSFLEIDEQLPSDTLPLTNWKHQRGNEVWAVALEAQRRWHWAGVTAANPLMCMHAGCCRLLDLMAEHGFASEAETSDWLARWQRVWQVGPGIRAGANLGSAAPHALGV